MDIVIKNGTLIDGTGAQSRRADIAIRNGKIQAIKENLSDRADTVIDATDMVVTPGFIDMVNHADTYLTLLQNPKSHSLLAQGITTAIIGNCGASLAPMTHGRLIAVVQKWADVREMNIDWQTYDEFLEVVDRFKPGINIAGFVGHTTLRRDILGDEFREPKEDELDQMVMLLEDAMDQGAFGLSLGLSYAHARNAPEWEIDRLVQAAARKGGILSVHLRNEREKLSEAVAEAIAIAKRADIALEISHMKSVGDDVGTTYPVAVKAIDAAAKEGLNVHFNLFPFETQHAVLYLLFPEWAQEGGFDALRKRLKDDTIKEKIVSEMKQMHIPWKDYTVAESSRGTSAIGKTLHELGEYTRTSPARATINLFLAHEGRVLLFHRCKGDSHLQEAISHDRARVVSAGGGYSLDSVKSGALVHPRSFGAMPEFLGHFVRDEKTLPLEEAIARISGNVAEKLGLKDRGVLREGAAADVVVFDPEKIANIATLEAPYQYPVGLPWVVVNGVVAKSPEGIAEETSGMSIRRED